MVLEFENPLFSEGAPMGVQWALSGHPPCGPPVPIPPKDG